MKIKAIEATYRQVMEKPRPKHRKPLKPNILFRTVIRVGSLPDMVFTRFKVKKINMDRLGKREPCLILMNHSSFIDMKIASAILYPRPYNIVSTTDAFIGKKLADASDRLYPH